MSVVIPAYNEEKRVRETIMHTSRYLSRQNYLSEVIVVNDGSKDGTSEIIRELELLVPNLRFIDNQKNVGKGGAVKQGMLSASGKYRLYMDADNAIPIEQVGNFWPQIKDYNIVIGSIEVFGSIKKEDYAGFSKIYRNVLGKLSKYLVRVLTIWEIHDTQRGFKLFAGEAAQKIFSKQTIMRWGFDIEILVIAKKLGYKIKELPVKWENPPGKVTFISYLNTLRELFVIKFNLLTGKYG